MGYDWNESADRKRFLNELAHDLNFDPLVPTNWYRIALKDITEKVYCQGIPTAIVAPHNITSLYVAHFILEPLHMLPLILVICREVTDCCTNMGIPTSKLFAIASPTST